MTFEDSPELERQPSYYGMALDALTDNVWNEIALLYYGTVYDNYLPDQKDLYITAANAREHINEGFRLGSRYSVHSKLQPIYERGQGEVRDLVRFDFYVNSDNPRHNDPETAIGQEVVAAQNEFTDKVRQYLESNGLAIAIY